MAELLVYYAHPGHEKSRVNRRMFEVASALPEINVVDLYARYPRFDINVDQEQQRLLQHDIIVLQFPMFWYSTPSLLKQWCDLVLEYGFAYGPDGNSLRGKSLLLAVTAGGSEHAFSAQGYQGYPLRSFLTPLERTAGLCKMHFPAPYVLYGSLHAPQEGRADEHIAGYRQLLQAIAADRFDHAQACASEVITAASLGSVLSSASGGPA